jgi:hypothetical protein
MNGNCTTCNIEKLCGYEYKPCDCRDYMKFKAIAQPASAARVPLTNFLMADEFTTTPFVDDVFAAFQQGVKFAEKHHGITTPEQS